MASFFKTARFAHDCAACRLIASVEPTDGRTFDLYVCDGEGSLVVRTSSDGPDYASMSMAHAALLEGETATDLGRGFYTYRLFRERQLIRLAA